MKRCMHDNQGFSILEVLIGVAIFMFGMMGIAALQLSSITSNTFAGDISEATYIAGNRIEELMNRDYDDDLLEDDDGDGDAAAQDTDEDGNDDDDDDATGNADTIAGADGVLNFGLDDLDAAADQSEPAPIGRNNMFDVYWNVADSYPLPNTKTIKVWVVWNVKGSGRRIFMQTVKEEVK